MNKIDIDGIVDDVMMERAIMDNVGFFKNSYSPHQPYERQELFLGLKDALEVFYGGAAGGGKSDAILMAALEYVHVENYAALLLRKTYSDLSQPGALMDRAREWLSGTDAHWSEKNKTYTFPSGATLTFGYLESEADKFRYQSSEFQFIGFDELSQFTETQYTYLFSRLRKLAGSPVPIRMRAGSNPGGVGGLWVKDRFIPEDFTPEKAMEAKVFLKENVDEETGTKKVRYFVPARMDDNPFIDRDEYDRTLRELDPVTRAQLRRGDWNITLKGDILYMWSEAHTVISWSQFKSAFGIPLEAPNQIPAHWLLSVYQDWGTTRAHPCVTGWFATAAKNSPTINGISLAGTVFWYRTHIRTRTSAKEMKSELMAYMAEGNEYRRCTTYAMSHEASSERLEYNDKDPETEISLPFCNWQTGKTRGIESLKTALTPIHTDRPSPFKPGVMGITKLMIIVDDDQIISPMTVMDGHDRGQSRVRAEAVVYKMDVPKSGEPPKTLVPYALFNDAMDVARSAAADYWPMAKELSSEELIKREMEKRLRFMIQPDKIELTEGRQIAIGIVQAQVMKKLGFELTPYGLSSTELDRLTDITSGW